ncbi:MAG: hypothetical protein QME14_00755 [Methanobacteriaceae archaeon]|nr:hypothetical protein [Methanobacteriaceae archaeon]
MGKNYKDKLYSKGLKINRRCYPGCYLHYIWIPGHQRVNEPRGPEAKTRRKPRW